MGLVEELADDALSGRSNGTLRAGTEQVAVLNSTTGCLKDQSLSGGQTQDGKVQFFG
jgi:hypothetical protein